MAVQIYVKEFASLTVTEKEQNKNNLQENGKIYKKKLGM